MIERGEKQRLVVKIGSSLLTEESGKLSCEKLAEHVEALVSIRAQSNEVILVSSGAIAAGFERMGFVSRPEAVVAKQACAAVGQGMLVRAYTDAFHEHGITVAQVLLTRKDFAERESYNNALNTFNLLLEKNVVPIINENDTVAVRELTFGDNDILAALVAALLHADVLVILSDTDGLYDADPTKYPEA